MFIEVCLNSLAYLLGLELGVLRSLFAVESWCDVEILSHFIHGFCFAVASLSFQRIVLCVALWLLIDCQSFSSHLQVGFKLHL